MTQQPASTLAEIILIKKPTSNEHAYIRRSGVAVEQRLDPSFYCDNTHYRISDRRRSFVDVVSFVGDFREIMQTLLLLDVIFLLPVISQMKICTKRDTIWKHLRFSLSEFANTPAWFKMFAAKLYVAIRFFAE